MSAVRSVQIVCDGCGDTADVPVTKFAEARAALEDQEWRVALDGGQADYCRRCASPRTLRHGDDIVVAHGRRVIARHAFPLNLPVDEWRSRLDALEMERARTADEDAEAALILASVSDFVRVESMIIGGA